MTEPLPEVRGSDKVQMRCPICFTERGTYKDPVTVARLEEISKSREYCGQCFTAPPEWTIVSVQPRYILGRYSDGNGYVWQKIGSKPPDRRS